jgi:hypothetical protein
VLCLHTHLYENKLVSIIAEAQSCSDREDSQVLSDVLSLVDNVSVSEIGDKRAPPANTSSNDSVSMISEPEGDGVPSWRSRQFPVFSIIENVVSNRRMVYSSELTDFAYLAKLLINIGLEDLIDEYNRITQSSDDFRPVSHMQRTISKLAAAPIDVPRMESVLSCICELLRDSDDRVDAKQFLCGICNLCGGDREEKTTVSFSLFDGDRGMMLTEFNFQYFAAMYYAMKLFG